jgi:glutaredoxin
MVKEFLSREGHTFTVRNIEDDSSAYDELLGLGFKVIPVTIVDGRAITGFDERALREALADASKS